MCWSTHYGILIKRHTASKDILVKKAFIVNLCEIRSFFYNDFTWIQGQLYKSCLGDIRKFHERSSPRRIPCWLIGQGFHSAKNIKIEERPSAFGCGWKRYMVMRSDKTDRSTEYPIGFYHANHIKILNCVIPKGSEYHLNEYGEYVSDQLIVLPNQ